VASDDVLDASDVVAPKDRATPMDTPAPMDAAPDVALDVPADTGALDAPDAASDAPADVLPDTPKTPDATAPDVPALDVQPDITTPDDAVDVPGDTGPDIVDTGPVCPAGQAVCDGRCVDIQVDRSNCGMCGRACASGEICMAGACALSCPAGQAPCGGACRTLASDVMHCGRCDNACALANATPACVMGACAVSACAANGCETDTRTTNAHCGRCGNACPSGQACRAGACVSTSPASCLEALRANPNAASGRYTLDPDGTGPVAPVEVYCNMTEDGGGWALIAQVGPSAPPTSRADLRADRNAATLVTGAAPTASEFSSLDLARFNAYSNRWTVRVVVDTANDGRAFQYTYYRPRTGATIAPGIAGSNWIDTATPAALEYLTRSTGFGQSNRMWLPVQGYDRTTATVALFMYRRAASSAACLDAAGENQLCHAPAGGIINEPGLTGTYTAAFTNGDGVAHTWGRRATYWLRDSVCAPERGDCDGDASNGCETALRDEARHCGACGRVCAGVEVCINGACQRPFPRNCQEQRTADPTATSGTFTIDPDGAGGLAPFLAYCDMTRDEGGWTLLGGGTWYNGSADQVAAPGAGNVLLSDARRNAVLATTARLYRLGSGAQRMYIRDTAAEFGPASPSGGRHYWRTNAASVRCGTAYAQVTADTLVTTSMRAVSCDPLSVGSHTCGVTSGWILWHTNDTYNPSGAHPCAFGTGALPTGGALSDLWVR
jgi:hypothetical protein